MTSPQSHFPFDSLMFEAFKHMEDCAFWCDGWGQILWANPAALRVLSYSLEELQILRVENVVANLTGNEWFTFWKRLQKKKSDQQEVHWMRRDGHLIPFEVNFTLTEYEGREVAFGIARDITPRLHARNAHRRSEEAFQTLVTNIPGAVYRCAIDDDWSMSFLSENVEKFTGYPASDFLGSSRRTFASLIHPQDSITVTKEVHEHVARNESFRVNYRIFHANGEIRWLQEWGRAVYNDKGEAVSLIGTIFDATELKSTEEALQRARAEAESANRAKSEFLATMSHEIRTPMNAIINMVRLSLETELSIRQRQYLDIVEASSRNLLTLLNDILDFSKIEANKLNIEEVTFSLFELIEEIANTFRDRVMESSLDFVLQVDPWLPDLVRGDPLRLRQILINLLSNAFKFTEEGEVSLIVESAFPSTDGVGLRFAVRDTGIGIAEDKLKSLFDAFTQADSSTTRQFGGTGLGLAISHRLVSLMADEPLRVQSELGEGSEFSFCLTLQPDSLEHSTFWEVSQDLIGLRAVLVEPHDEQRQILQSWFKRVGIECSVQPSIPAAVELLREWMLQPGRAIADILVVDVGREYRKSDIDLLREYWFPTLPILLVGSSPEAECDTARSRDRILYQQQPVTPTSLFMALQSACFGQVDGHSLQDSFSLRWSGQFDGCSVLLVEDNHANQFVAREMLTQSGFEVVVAENGLEAVQKVRERTFGAVLMDMQMPEMDGIEATQHIRQEWPKRTLPIIAMTANAMQGDAQRCLAAGMDDYIAKPVHREHLLKKLYRWLFTPREMSSYLSPFSTNSTPAAFELSPSYVQTEPELETPPEGTRLPRLQGIDVQEALERLKLPLELFVQLWEGFVEEQEQQLRELEQAVEEQQFEHASHVAHSLAGASANLAAPALQSAARELELAAKHPQPELLPLLQQVKRQASIVQQDLALLTLMLPDPNDGF